MPFQGLLIVGSGIQGRMVGADGCPMALLPAVAATAVATAFTVATTAVAATPVATAIATAFAVATATVAAVAATTTATFAGGGFVDADHPTHPFDILEVVDGFLLSCVIRQLNKGKTAFAACFPIKGQAALAHLSVLAEEIKQVLAFCLEREVADVDGH